MNRVEIMCAKCGSHLGHVFTDGHSNRNSTDKVRDRHCVNSISVKYMKGNPPDNAEEIWLSKDTQKVVKKYQNIEDILYNESKTDATEEQMTKARNIKDLDEPSCIFSDWLYLGNARHAQSMNILNKFGITHILNITTTIPCYYPDKIKYAKIGILDVDEVVLRDYFEVSHKFIDLCNPDISNNNSEYKILVHCAMGVSRSASFIISYLMNRNININNLNDTTVINEVINELNTYTTKYNEYKKLNRNTNIIKNFDEMYEANNYIGWDLGLSHNYVRMKRDIICPNIGFLKELELFEKNKHGKSTLYMLPIYRKKFGKQSNNKSCKDTCVIL